MTNEMTDDNANPATWIHALAIPIKFCRVNVSVAMFKGPEASLLRFLSQIHAQSEQWNLVAVIQGTPRIHPSLRHYYKISPTRTAMRMRVREKSRAWEIQYASEIHQLYKHNLSFWLPWRGKWIPSYNKIFLLQLTLHKSTDNHFYM